MDRSWWRVLIKRGPLEERKANHSCWEPTREIPPMIRSCGRALTGKVESGLEGLPDPTHGKGHEEET